MNIGILTNMPTPYRTGMWKAYSKVKDVNITLFYCTSKEKDRYWHVEKEHDLKEIFLPGLTLFNSIHINFSIIKYFLKNDAWIVGGYNSITFQIIIILSIIFKKPYILMIDGINPQKLKHNDNFLLEFLKSFYIEHQFLALANGLSGQAFMRKYNLPYEKIINQYLTVDVDRFFKLRKETDTTLLKVRDYYHILESDVVILYVGRLVKDKGIQDLIVAGRQIIKEGVHLKILIVGEGNYRQELLDITENDSNISFCGEIPYNELYKYYLSSDIFCLPTYEDVWGLSINEAMSFGLPIITTTSAGAYMDLIQDNGISYQAKNISDLKKAIKTLIGLKSSNLESKKSKTKLKQLGKKSSEIISKYTYTKSQISFQKVIDSLREHLK